MNLASPGTGLDAVALDELLEPLQVAFYAPGVHADSASERLSEPFGVVRELDVDPGALGAERLVA